MTSKETKKIKEKLSQLETALERDWGLSMLNGGYVALEMYDYDDDTLFINCVSGVLGDRKTIENFELSRETLEFI